MKKILLLLASFLFLFVGNTNAQTVPAGITSYLNANHAGWTKAPSFCESKKWFLTGDFDGDRQTDYVVRFKVGKRSPRLRLYAFLNTGGQYMPIRIFEDAYSTEFQRSAFLIVKKGRTVSLGQGEEGQGPTTKLKTDAITQYICETDASITYIYKNGKFSNISDQ